MRKTVEASAERRKIHFPSGDTTCAGWHYRGDSGACVIMAAGGGVPKEPGTDRFATAFHRAGFSVVAFDYRRLGESGGQPRQLVRIREQLEDWQAAIEFAMTLPEAKPEKLAIWGYSLSGGHVFCVAARNPNLGAAIAHAPTADGQAATRNAMRHQSPFAAMRMTSRGIRDAVGGLFGRKPRLVPLAGKRGIVAMLTTPDSLDAERALNPKHEYPPWSQEIAARSALRIGFYRPGRYARRITCPLLVVVHDQDQTALSKPAIRAANRALNSEVVRLPGGHYGGYLESHAQAVETELAFLQRNLTDRPAASSGRMWIHRRGASDASSCEDSRHLA